MKKQKWYNVRKWSEKQKQKKVTRKFNGKILNAMFHTSFSSINYFKIYICEYKRRNSKSYVEIYYHNFTVYKDAFKFPSTSKNF